MHIKFDSHTVHKRNKKEGDLCNVTKTESNMSIDKINKCNVFKM